MFASIRAKLARAHRSLTLWFNAVAASVVTALPILQDAFPAMHDYIPDNLYKSAMGVVVAGNILLRFRTNQPLESK